MSKSVIVLIDGESVSPSFSAQIFNYAGSLGSVASREIYGPGASLGAWTEAILEYAVGTSFTLEGNAACAMVIGAVEIMHDAPAAEGDEPVFLLVTNTDLSSLAVHLRKKGICVIGMGERETVSPLWIRACTAFEPLAVPGAAEESAPVSAPSADTEAQPVQSGEQTAGSLPQAASSHRARLSIIRQIISGQIAASGGRVRSRDLFKVLSSDPNYQMDQRKSRRNPLDYLRTQFDPWFSFEPGEKGTCWISDKHSPHAAPDVSETEAAPPEEAEQASVSVPDKPAPEGDREETAPAFSLPVPLESENVSSEALTTLGIPLIHADRAAELLAGCRNMRGVYNAMRRAFGNELGKKYYEILRSVPLVFPDREQERKTEDDSARPLTREEISELYGTTAAPAKETTPEPSPEAAPAPEDPADTETPAPLTAELSTDDTALRLTSAPVRWLMEHGVTSDKAVRIVKIYTESANQRIAYNELRKAFGDKGRQYLKMMKEIDGTDG